MNFGGPVRSHSPHGLWDALGSGHLLLQGEARQKASDIGMAAHDGRTGDRKALANAGSCGEKAPTPLAACLS